MRSRRGSNKYSSLMHVILAAEALQVALDIPEWLALGFDHTAAFVRRQQGESQASRMQGDRAALRRASLRGRTSVPLMVASDDSQAAPGAATRAIARPHLRARRTSAPSDAALGRALHVTSQSASFALPDGASDPTAPSLEIVAGSAVSMELKPPNAASNMAGSSFSSDGLAIRPGRTGVSAATQRASDRPSTLIASPRPRNHCGSHHGLPRGSESGINRELAGADLDESDGDVAGGWAGHQRKYENFSVSDDDLDSPGRTDPDPDTNIDDEAAIGFHAAALLRRVRSVAVGASSDSKIAVVPLSRTAALETVGLEAWNPPISRHAAAVAATPQPMNERSQPLRSVLACAAPARTSDWLCRPASSASTGSAARSGPSRSTRDPGAGHSEMGRLLVPDLVGEPLAAVDEHKKGLGTVIDVATDSSKDAAELRKALGQSDWAARRTAAASRALAATMSRQLSEAGIAVTMTAGSGDSPFAQLGPDADLLEAIIGAVEHGKDADAAVRLATRVRRRQLRQAVQAAPGSQVEAARAAETEAERLAGSLLGGGSVAVSMPSLPIAAATTGEGGNDSLLRDAFGAAHVAASGDARAFSVLHGAETWTGADSLVELLARRRQGPPEVLQRGGAGGSATLLALARTGRSAIAKARHMVALCRKQSIRATKAAHPQGTRSANRQVTKAANPHARSNGNKAVTLPAKSNKTRGTGGGKNGKNANPRTTRVDGEATSDDDVQPFDGSLDDIAPPPREGKGGSLRKAQNRDAIAVAKESRAVRKLLTLSMGVPVASPMRTNRAFEWASRVSKRAARAGLIPASESLGRSGRGPASSAGWANNTWANGDEQQRSPLGDGGGFGKEERGEEQEAPVTVSPQRRAMANAAKGEARFAALSGVMPISPAPVLAKSLSLEAQYVQLPNSVAWDATLSAFQATLDWQSVEQQSQRLFEMKHQATVQEALERHRGIVDSTHAAVVESTRRRSPEKSDSELQAEESDPDEGTDTSPATTGFNHKTHDVAGAGLALVATGEERTAAERPATVHPASSPTSSPPAAESNSVASLQALERPGPGPLILSASVRMTAFHDSNDVAEASRERLNSRLSDGKSSATAVPNPKPIAASPRLPAPQATVLRVLVPAKSACVLAGLKSPAASSPYAVPSSPFTSLRTSSPINHGAKTPADSVSTVQAVQDAAAAQLRAHYTHNKARARRHWAILRAWLNRSLLVVRQLQTMMQSRDMAQLAVDSGAVTTTLTGENGSRADEVSAKNQGHSAFLSDAAVRVRRKLSNDARVTAAIRNVWDMLTMHNDSAFDEDDAEALVEEAEFNALRDAAQAFGAEAVAGLELSGGDTVSPQSAASLLQLGPGEATPRGRASTVRSSMSPASPSLPHRSDSGAQSRSRQLRVDGMPAVADQGGDEEDVQLLRQSVYVEFFVRMHQLLAPDEMPVAEAAAAAGTDDGSKAEPVASSNGSGECAPDHAIRDAVLEDWKRDLGTTQIKARHRRGMDGMRRKKRKGATTGGGGDEHAKAAGPKLMAYEQAHTAMFETVDTWTDSLVVADYVAMAKDMAEVAMVAAEAVKADDDARRAAAEELARAKYDEVMRAAEATRQLLDEQDARRRRREDELAAARRVSEAARPPPSPIPQASPEPFTRLNGTDGDPSQSPTGTRRKQLEKQAQRRASDPALRGLLEQQRGAQRFRLANPNVFSPFFAHPSVRFQQEAVKAAVLFDMEMTVAEARKATGHRVPEAVSPSAVGHLRSTSKLLRDSLADEGTDGDESATAAQGDADAGGAAGFGDLAGGISRPRGDTEPQSMSIWTPTLPGPTPGKAAGGHDGGARGALVRAAASASISHGVALPADVLLLASQSAHRAWLLEDSTRLPAKQRKRTPPRPGARPKAPAWQAQPATSDTESRSDGAGLSGKSPKPPRPRPHLLSPRMTVAQPEASLHAGLLVGRGSASSLETGRRPQPSAVDSEAIPALPSMQTQPHASPRARPQTSPSSPTLLASERLGGSTGEAKTHGTESPSGTRHRRPARARTPSPQPRGRSHQGPVGLFERLMQTDGAALAGLATLQAGEQSDHHLLELGDTPRMHPGVGRRQRGEAGASWRNVDGKQLPERSAKMGLVFEAANTRGNTVRSTSGPRLTGSRSGSQGGDSTPAAADGCVLGRALGDPHRWAEQQRRMRRPATASVSQARHAPSGAMIASKALPILLAMDRMQASEQISTAARLMVCLPIKTNAAVPDSRRPPLEPSTKRTPLPPTPISMAMRRLGWLAGELGMTPAAAAGLLAAAEPKDLVQTSESPKRGRHSSLIRPRSGESSKVTVQRQQRQRQQRQHGSAQPPPPASRSGSVASSWQLPAGSVTSARLLVTMQNGLQSEDGRTSGVTATSQVPLQPWHEDEGEDATSPLPAVRHPMRMAGGSGHIVVGGDGGSGGAAADERMRPATLGPVRRSFAGIAGTSLARAIAAARVEARTGDSQPGLQVTGSLGGVVGFSPGLQPPPGHFSGARLNQPRDRNPVRAGTSRRLGLTIRVGAADPLQLPSLQDRAVRAGLSPPSPKVLNPLLQSRASPSLGATLAATGPAVISPVAPFHLDDRGEFGAAERERLYVDGSRAQMKGGPGATIRSGGTPGDVSVVVRSPAAALSSHSNFRRRNAGQSSSPSPGLTAPRFTPSVAHGSLAAVEPASGGPGGGGLQHGASGASLQSLDSCSGGQVREYAAMVALASVRASGGNVSPTSAVAGSPALPPERGAARPTPDSKEQPLAVSVPQLSIDGTSILLSKASNFDS